MAIKRALLSVYNKEGIADFGKFLSEQGIGIVSSGGTSKALRDAGVQTFDVADLTGFPEMMEGRVKTLHPKIHGGILAKREKEEHMEQAQSLGVGMIDLVAVNLYPFEEVTSLPDCTVETATENIDIGGPTLIRAAAKNFENVVVISNPARYGEVSEEITANGDVSLETRRKLAVEAFMEISHYDTVIESFLRSKFFPEQKTPEYLNLSFRKMQDLRYGENPSQGNAALYKDPQLSECCVPNFSQLQGRELSYNNILDINAAFALLKQFKEPTAVIVKHNNPCGVATNGDIVKAYEIALAVDSDAAFGGIVCLNRKVEKDLAEKIITRFYEVIVAPSFAEEALEIFSRKKRLRAIETGECEFPVKRPPQISYRSICGGLLTQDVDILLYDPEKLKVVTERKPTEQEMKDLMYAWTICKYVKSNSIVYARSNQAIGIGAGQMKRVDAARLAADIAESRGETLKGCAMASDAFFPFRDGIDTAAERGVTSIIQPGGSIRDQEVIEAANEHGMAMLFTGTRHFRH
ncbi:bifunctional phosphoribosylaminoimidazolecarboxamide formyltransferase/IMP cyclohydrolase [Candidatus Micrarchaeota archaeon]|nr:bifunctional phosphoribosylaminoimidazolecarboxamide formyltransferase/IMP cyclohydrolase [Candidatus Micrarchaeota archaeon]MBD3417602.1 bifunctional phosphoribosylaminoimidazolecarboxamide formyltransferase/IMP cyclohydrolase [Candidatus Micrarchaeota archaeon]